MIEQGNLEVSLVWNAIGKIPTFFDLFNVNSLSECGNTQEMRWQWK